MVSQGYKDIRIWRRDPEPDQWASIINQAKSGDSAAFDQLASFYQDRLRRFISRKLSNEADSADLCQEVLFRAYSKLNTFQGGSSFDTWLFSIAKRAVAEYYRSSLLVQQFFGKIKLTHRQILLKRGCLLMTIALKRSATYVIKSEIV